jgi:basic membrane protein A and related proteins
MTNSWRKSAVCLLTALLGAVLAAPGIVGGQTAPKVAFIYVGPVGDAGWTYQWDQARKYLEQHVSGTQTAYVESVQETADVARVENDFIAKGFSVIFATAFGYQNFTVDVAKQHPNVTFVGIGPAIKLAPNVSTVYGKLWEGRYLTGIVAGKMTRTNVIGFVAAHPITTVVAGVNAFALGVRSVNPAAKVKVVWTDTWYDPPKEKQAAQSLLDAGADVIAQHQDTPSALSAASQAGKWGVGSESNMQRFAPKAYLTGTTWTWGPLVEKIVKASKTHSWSSQDYYGNLKDGVVGLGPINMVVPAAVKSRVAAKMRGIESGSFQIFAGPLRDQTGKLRVNAGHTMSLQEVLGFDWLVQGVEGKSPK